MKKDITRFTIRFCPADPRHQRAMEVLNQAGRRKASLIADAICYYLRCAENSDYKSGKQRFDQKALVLESKKSEMSETLETSAKSDSTSKKVTFVEGDMRQAVLGGLKMFGGS
jgi:hypothetical protein